MKLCNSCLLCRTASRNARMPADETPSASGVLRGSLSAPAAGWIVRHPGTNESKPIPAAPTPTCLRNALRFKLMPRGFRHHDPKDKLKRHPCHRGYSGGLGRDSLQRCNARLVKGEHLPIVRGRLEPLTIYGCRDQHHLRGRTSLDRDTWTVQADLDH